MNPSVPKMTISLKKNQAIKDTWKLCSAASSLKQCQLQIQIRLSGFYLAQFWNPSERKCCSPVQQQPLPQLSVQHKNNNAIIMAFTIKSTHFFNISGYEMLQTSQGINLYINSETCRLITVWETPSLSSSKKVSVIFLCKRWESHLNFNLMKDQFSQSEGKLR